MTSFKAVVHKLPCALELVGDLVKMLVPICGPAAEPENLHF